MNKLRDRNIKKELGILVTKEYNGLLNYAFPLCILLTDNNNIPWFYENYIGICAKQDDDGGMWLWNTETISYLETDHYSNSIININKLDDNIIELDFDIIKYVRKNIDSDTYNVVFVDEYYIGESMHYKKSHLIHEYLIYGYNDLKTQLNVVGFDKNNQFSKLVITYEDFQKGFNVFLRENKEKAILDYYIYTLKLNTRNSEYPFDLQRVLKKLNNYIAGYMESDEKYFWGFSENKEGKFKYGIQVYDSLICYFKNIMNNSIEGDYRVIHIFYDNRNCMLQRLKFISNTYKDMYEISKYIEDFSKVIDNIRLIRNLFHKVSLVNGQNGFILEYIDNDFNFKKIDKIIGLLLEGKQKEAEILSNVCDVIKVYIDNKR